MTSPAIQLKLLIFFSTLGIFSNGHSATITFSKDTPYKCAGWFKKNPPEIAPFKATLESFELFIEIKNLTAWSEKHSLEKRQKALKSLFALVMRTLNTEPYVSQSSTTRSILLSWALLEIFPDYILINLESQVPTAEWVLHFMRREVLHAHQYSSEDLKRLKQAFLIFVSHTFYLASEYKNFLSKETQSLFDKEIEAQILIEQAEKVWSIEFPRILGSKLGMLKDSDGSDLIDLANKSVRALQDSHQSNAIQIQKIATWIQDLARINPLHFKISIQVYKIFVSYIRSKALTHDETKSIQDAFRKLIEGWQKYNSAHEAGNAALAVPLQVTALDPQSTEGPK